MQSNPVQLAKKTGDKVVLGITIALVVIAMVVLALYDVTYLFISAAVVGISLFYVRLFQVQFLGNALRVQNGRNAFLTQIVAEVSRDLRMPYVDVFITQDPYLNAFAIGYTHPYTIVLHSATVEQLTKDELRAVLVHEMGHIKYRQTIVTAYLYPLGQLVPVVGPVVNWVFGFWSRRAELNCDRLALAYTRDPHTVMMALIKVYVGSNFAEYMKEEGVLYQQKIGSGIMTAISQSTVNHPFLVTRVTEILRMSEKWGIPVPQETLAFLHPSSAPQ